MINFVSHVTDWGFEKIVFGHLGMQIFCISLVCNIIMNYKQL